MRELKILLFGDSITAGYMDGETTMLYNNALSDFLLKRGIKAACYNAGVPGETSADGLRRAKRVAGYPYDIVLVMFGVNDAADHRYIERMHYLENLKKIISYFQKEKLILVSPSWVDETLHPERPDKRLRAYVAAARKAAEMSGVAFVDLYQAMQPAPKQYLQPDGMHFASAGYLLLAKIIGKKIIEMAGR